MKQWLRRMFCEQGSYVEVAGTPVEEGTELVTCSFCHSVTPAVAFYDHVRYHAQLQYTGKEDE